MEGILSKYPNSHYNNINLNELTVTIKKQNKGCKENRNIIGGLFEANYFEMIHRCFLWCPTTLAPFTVLVQIIV
jgi:hypothetical protein